MAAWAAEEGWREAPICQLERPAEEAHGDYATPVCMQMARAARRSPRHLAEELRLRLLADKEVARLVESIEVAGPGFLNLYLNGTAYSEAMTEMLAQGEEIGRVPPRAHPRINLEFVSVNPNGPLHVGHGRYAAYGDSLHRLLAFSGANVTTEFYINDFGRQMDRFGRSVAARYAQSFDLDLPVPGDGYQGDYVNEIAAGARAKVGDRYVAALRPAAVERRPAAAAGAESGGAPSPRAGEDLAAMAEEVFEDEGAEESSDWPQDPGVLEAVAFFKSWGCQAMLEGMRTELAGFGVLFDCWFSETALHSSGRLERVVQRLLETGEAYREGDAVWLRTTSRGDDKDRVLIRSNDQPTYFAADIAYHEDKLERGFEHLINIWGADHHGYVPRMNAAVEILSGRPGTLEVIIGQLVNLLEEGALKQMSTRRGEMVTLAELIDAIGVDAARFFLVSRSQDQTLDLDIDLARRHSQENPVYYVQYAHARISGIVRNVPEGTVTAISEGSGVFASPYERALIKRLESFSSVVQDAAERRAPHRIVAYAQELSADFHVFYKHCRVIGAEPDDASARFALCLVVRRVVFRCLDLLGVSAPESM
ncbi:MAG: arginine--tRNA ligase [Actinobacteria bacterium RBG_16_64_13]|nr:MAG: arginine--tRNA ligase [Actinobacteria bacterium RBG_16_64_13]